MTNLILLILTGVLTLAVWFWQRGRPSKAAALLTMGIGCLTLVLALRFGARTYPGIWHPESKLLNDIFNGVALFVVFGYNAVLVAGATAALLILAAPKGWPRTSLVVIKWAGFALAGAIALYGFYWAIYLERLP